MQNAKCKLQNGLLPAALRDDFPILTGETIFRFSVAMCSMETNG